jgi:hypothetical protein
VLSSVLDRIMALLQSCSTDSPLLPPATLYNANWLLRLVIDWFVQHPLPDHALRVSPDACWYAGPRLPTVFEKRHQGDSLAEKRPRVDGAIGHFDVQNDHLALHRDARHFVTLLAALADPLPPGIDKARYFDRAASCVAGMAEALHLANRYPPDVAYLGFYVVAPHTQILHGVFAEPLSRESLRQKGKQRVEAYGAKRKQQWYHEWLVPAVQHVELAALSWESLIDTIRQHDPLSAAALDQFYARCLALA